jgi:RNA polymerase sigma factor for flagellar operon FliA
MHRAIANYAATPASSDEELLRKYGPLIERSARRIVMRTGLHSAYDDLWSAGALGLIEAARRYDGARGASFETFAEHRVRGAMLDELRRMDHLPRRLRNRTDDLQKSKRKLSAELGRDATIDEVAADLKIDVEEASGIETLLEPHLPLESALPFLVTEEGLDDPVVRADALRSLVAALEGLSDRLQTLLHLHYVEGLTYREIAQIFKVSEPRVCQLHGEALNKLRQTISGD